MASSEGFHKALDIYILRPQVVNRRCAGATIGLAKAVNKPVTWAEELSEVCGVVESNGSVDDCCQLHPSAALLTAIDNINDLLKNSVKLTVRKLISKQSSVLFPHELIVSDSTSYHLLPIESRDGQLFPVGVIYSLVYDAESKSISMFTSKQEQQLSCTTTSQQWLSATLLPKLIKWAQSDNILSASTASKSMNLIDIDCYYSKYVAMKDKYGKAISEIWPECTDPLKFVYEDVAIASYLICIWEEEREKMGLSEKQTFVDLGCGNGLLVYILCDQGYPGYGVDVRKRRVWDLFSAVADLREHSLVPAESGLFPEVDWLIGNHSDELTPWIPVMAARSSRSCQFFVLPCCPHDFYSKYQRIDASQSVYSEYLQYIYKVATNSGFLCKRDSLRIPSTRKECIIGSRNPQLSGSEYQCIDMRIAEMIGEKDGHAGVHTSVSLSASAATTAAAPTPRSHAEGSASQPTFTPRSSVEPVTNCARVEQSVQQKIMKLVTDVLLATENYESCCGESGDRRWNAGGIISLSLVAKLLTEHNLLADLKSECGGLKTLLKNHHHICTVLPGAKVRLCNFSTDLKEVTPLASARLKTKICWFYESHPDGCRLSAPHCRYAHGSLDLQLPIH